MPHRRRLVTYLTTSAVVPLVVLIVLGLMARSTGAETVRQGSLQVSFGGSVSPASLPRAGTTPVAVTIRGHVRALAGGPPPSLRRIAIEVNRVGVLDRVGLAILAHLFTSRPAPLTFVLAFALGRAHGTFGTRLVATVPARTRATAHITSFALRLGRFFTVAGERRSFLSAGCPAPAGFPNATFPLVRASYGFVGEKTVADTLVRTCRAAAET